MKLRKCWAIGGGTCQEPPPPPPPLDLAMLSKFGVLSHRSLWIVPKGPVFHKFWCTVSVPKGWCFLISFTTPVAKLQTRMHSSRMRTDHRGSSHLRQEVSPCPRRPDTHYPPPPDQTPLPSGRNSEGDPSPVRISGRRPPVNRMTHARENTTFPILSMRSVITMFVKHEKKPLKGAL